MGRIYKRGKTWYLDIRVNGKRVRRRVGASKEIAQLALKDAEVKVARHEFGFEKRDISVEGFFSKFLEHAQANVRAGTLQRYKSVVANFTRFLDNETTITRLIKISPETLDQFKIYRRRPKTESPDKKSPQKGALPSTVNSELRILSGAFNLAVKWKYIRENPLSSVARFKLSNSKSVRFLSKDECRHFLESCPGNLHPIFFTYLNTGMRRSELENLEWEDIDFRRRVIKVQWKEFWQPKSGKRDIPMTKELYDLLKGLKKSNATGLKSNFVFPGSDGGIIRLDLREKLRRIAEKAGLSNLTKVHTLRHTFASHLVMNGVDLPTVQKLLGHASVQTTMIYAHLAPEHLAGAVEKLGISSR